MQLMGHGLDQTQSVGKIIPRLCDCMHVQKHLIRLY